MKQFVSIIQVLTLKLIISLYTDFYYCSICIDSSRPLLSKTWEIICLFFDKLVNIYVILNGRTNFFVNKHRDHQIQNNITNSGNWRTNHFQL